MILCIATNFFHRIQEKHLHAKIKCIAFTLLKPWFVRHIKEWNTYYWCYHMDLVEFHIGLNNMHSKTRGLCANCDCRCVICCPLGVDQNFQECCAYQISFSRLTNLWTSIVCPIVDGHEWHKQACLMGECTLCGLALRRCALQKRYWVQNKYENMPRLWLAERTMVIQGKSPSCSTWIFQPLNCWTTYVQD